MNVHLQLPNKTSHKLFYGLYTSRLDLHASYVLSTKVSEVKDRKHSPWKYKNLVSPLKSVLEGRELKMSRIFDEFQVNALTETFTTQCSDLVAFYQCLSLNHHNAGKIQWTIDPAYVAIDADTMAVNIRFRYYFKQREECAEFFESIKNSQHIGVFHQSQICEVSDQAEKIIGGDRYTTVMKRLPYKKYTGRLWVNYSRLRKMTDSARTNALRVLEAYEEQRLIKCQPMLKKFLKGQQRFLWNDPYIYVEELSIKSMLDLVLVNIITREERIILENG